MPRSSVIDMLINWNVLIVFDYSYSTASLIQVRDLSLRVCGSGEGSRLLVCYWNLKEFGRVLSLLSRLFC